MPRIAEFFGIVISMYHEEHGVPHFHAYYGEHRAVFGCDPVQHLGGRLPKRAQRLVLAWAEAHRDELVANWQRLRAGEPPERIAALR